MQTRLLLVKRDLLDVAERRQSAVLASQHADIMRENNSLRLQLSTALDVGTQSHQVTSQPALLTSQHGLSLVLLLVCISLLVDTQYCLAAWGHLLSCLSLATLLVTVQSLLSPPCPPAVLSWSPISCYLKQI